MNDGDIKFIEGWEAAKNRIWQQPDGLCSSWLSDLPAGVRVPMPAIVDMLAFGHAAQADGVSGENAWTARIVAARELFRATATVSSADVIYGQRAERWIIGSAQPINKKVGDPGPIDPQEFADDVLTISPLTHAWLAPASIAADPTLWGTPQAVSYVDLTIDRKWFGARLNELSGKAAKKLGRPPEYPWGEIEAETVRLMDYNGDFTVDDPGWKQARLEKELLEFCARKIQREPSESQLRARLKPWLKKWGRNKAKAGN
jgi:hypothetical protein